MGKDQRFPLFAESKVESTIQPQNIGEKLNKIADVGDLNEK